MNTPNFMKSQVLKRDGTRCNVCGITGRTILAAHHVIPVEFGGEDLLANLVALCADCHRIVHWLAGGDRVLHPNAFGVGATLSIRKKLVEFARRIRDARIKQIGPDLVMRHAVPLSTAITAVVAKNKLDRAEAQLMERCFRRAWGAMQSDDRKACSLRLPRAQRFISVSANNHLALRMPAWHDDGWRDESGDILLIWPEATRPSILKASEFYERVGGVFRLIPYTNLPLTWKECLALTSADWRIFSWAVHEGLHLVKTKRLTSNVVPD